jgi:hypothetical protein
MIAATKSRPTPGSEHKLRSSDRAEPFGRLEGLCVAAGTVVSAVVLGAVDHLPHHRHRNARR